MRTLSLTIALAATLAGAAPATPGHAKPKAKAAAQAVLVCPVTGEKIASIKDAQGHSTYKGKTYYFCCASCKPEFDKNPDKYIHAVESKGGK
ncbi:MAG: YHS domain-containing protein [Armatimonadetes bacterium]|nr:YHS domain-containing protein [Armatimonadota bacterium]